MRPTRLLLPVLLALTAAACSSQKPAYYVTDAATGQRVSTAQTSNSQARRGLFSLGSSRASGAYAYAATQNGASSGRGLFSADTLGSGLFGRRSRAPVYGYQPQPQPPQTYSYQPQQQPYAYRPAPQRTYARQSATMQYRPPQPAQQIYAQQPYQQPQPRPAGYDAERYRWY